MNDPWDRRYATADRPSAPAWVLSENAHLLPSSGRALDLACGLGGSALFLARRGLTVAAWDRSPVALEKLAAWAAQEGLSVQPRRVDLTRESPPPGAFDVVVVAHFLHRPLLGAIADALAPGGLLFYQTFTQVPAGWSRGPASPDLRLTQGELLRRFAMLEPLFYREDGDSGDPAAGRRGLAHLVARRRL